MSSVTGDPGEADGPVIGVVAGSGGAGASSFAAALARAAAARAGRGLLIDVDPTGGGIDVLLGIERDPGARWSGLRLGGGFLEPDALWGGLPRFGPVAVLAADTGDLDPAAVGQVIDTGAELGPVVLDLPRGPTEARDEAAARCRVVVVVARGDLPGLVAARAALTSLPDVPAGVVVRGGDVDPAQAAGVVGGALLGELPLARAGRGGLDPDRLPPSFTALARGVLDGLAAPRPGRRLVVLGAA
ncbi:hypothetical protein [Jatrophihabitans endophyticus]|uniref:hypothetical protein n=1 Tax=Jatrophihabitans endophyticus TaxID=1206085 RepID=UPI001A0A85B4|nr:hypothetical protein [Jatrophihabitans endophyticus]MBE7189760.1 hypothetical protein [Jatrophihabitans endophyticus]